MKRYVYEVISTNIHNGSKDCDYFDSERAANKWKESKERNGVFSAEVRKLPLWGMKDI